MKVISLLKRFYNFSLPFPSHFEIVFSATIVILLSCSTFQKDFSLKLKIYSKKKQKTQVYCSLLEQYYPLSLIFLLVFNK